MYLSIVHLANTYLGAINVRRIVPWDAPIIELLGEEEGAKTVAKIQLDLSQKNGEGFVPTGTYVGSTASALEYVPDIYPSQISDVLAVLKSEGRIVQVGKGKGVALVIPNGFNPIPYNAEPEKKVDKTDLTLIVKQLANTIDDFRILSTRYYTAVARVKELEAENSVLQNQITKDPRLTWS